MASDKMGLPQGYLGDSLCCKEEESKKEKRKEEKVACFSFFSPSQLGSASVGNLGLHLQLGMGCGWLPGLGDWTGRGGVAGGSYPAAHQEPQAWAVCPAEKAAPAAGEQLGGAKGSWLGRRWR